MTECEIRKITAPLLIKQLFAIHAPALELEGEWPRLFEMNDAERAHELAERIKDLAKVSLKQRDLIYSHLGTIDVVSSQVRQTEARVSALFEEGRRQGAENVSRLLGPDGKIHAIVDGVSADGEAVLSRIVNTKKPERDYFSDRNLSMWFGTHVNTIAYWRKGKVKPPEGFGEAFEKKDCKAMRVCAEKYKANRECADAMNTKGVEHGISEEQMHRQRLK